MPVLPDGAWQDIKDKTGPDPMGVRPLVCPARGSASTVVLLGSVPGEDGGHLCPAGSVVRGQGVVADSGDHAFADGPGHGVDGVVSHQVGVGVAAQVAGNLNGLLGLKVGEPIEEGSHLLPGQRVVGEKVVSEVPSVMLFSAAQRTASVYHWPSGTSVKGFSPVTSGWYYHPIQNGDQLGTVDVVVGENPSPVPFIRPVRVT